MIAYAMPAFVSRQTYVGKFIVETVAFVFFQFKPNFTILFTLVFWYQKMMVGDVPTT